jgi:putative beta barrel porin BBP7
MRIVAMTHTRKKTLAVLALGGWLGAVANGQQPQQLAPASPPAMSSAAPSDPAAPVAPLTTYHGGGQVGGWFVDAEYLLWRRDVPQRFLGFVDINNNFINDSADLNIDTRQLHFPFESGFRIQAGYLGDDGLGFDASFMAFEHWQNSTTATATTPAGGAGNIISAFPIFVPPFDNAASYAFNYNSRLYGGEINGRCNYACDSATLSLLAGFRYVQLNDDFSLSAQGTTTGFPGAPLATGQYTVSTHNNLYGAQVGGEAFINLAESLRLQLMAKAGVFDNFMSQRSAIVNAFVGGAPFAVAGAASSDRVASVVEFGAFLHWWATPNVGIKAGVEGMFLTNVALAPDQLQFSVAPGAQSLLDGSGKVFYYGPTVGLEANW